MVTFQKRHAPLIVKPQVRSSRMSQFSGLVFMHTLIVSPTRDHPTTLALGTQLESLQCGPVQCIDFEQAAVTIRSTSPEIIVVVLEGLPSDQVIASVRRLRAAESGHLLATGPATDAKLILKIMQAGAEVFLDQSELTKELRSALYRIRVRQTNPDEPGRLLAVLSTAGGCGGTSIALNLAVGIARDRGHCNLIDLNLGKADLAPLLDLKPQYTLVDLCRNDQRLDRSLYEKLLAPHSSGVALLAAPQQLSDHSEMTSETIARAIDLACESFADVVVDLEDSVHDEQVHVLRKATRIFLVNRLDFTLIRHTRRMLDQFDRADIPRNRIEIVVNQYREDEMLPLAEAEEVLKLKLTHLVPYDAKTLGTSSNEGIPAAMSAKDTEVVQCILKLVGLDTPRPPLPSALTRLRSGLSTGFSAIRGYGSRIRERTHKLTPMRNLQHNQPIVGEAQNV